MSQQKQISVDITKLKNVSCACGNKFFEKTFVIKIIPRLMIGAPEDVPQPVELYRCTDCKIVLPDFIKAIAEPKEVPEPAKISIVK